MGGVALIKFTGGSDLLLVVQAGYGPFYVFHVCSNQFLNLNFGSCCLMLIPRPVAMLILFASFWYTVFDHETCK